MPGFLANLLRVVRNRRGSDMRFLCGHLLSSRGEASQTALAQEIIHTYRGMDSAARLKFFDMLAREFSPVASAIVPAAEKYISAPGTQTLAALSAAVEAPRQELFRRLNTAPGGTEALVAMRGDLLDLCANALQGGESGGASAGAGSAGAGETSNAENLRALDSDLRHLFRSWFNRGFLRLERIGWDTPALLLEKLMRYESVHEINGWPDLRRRLESDRRCFAFFHPALAGEPIIFVEVALATGLGGNIDPLLDVSAPMLDTARADTAIFYSINNCLKGLRNVPLGNFLIKQVVEEVAAELPGIRIYGTLSPLPRFAKALRNTKNEHGFTTDRLCRLLVDFAPNLMSVAGRNDPVTAFLQLLEKPLDHREALAAPLERLALAYLTRAKGADSRPYDPVATFHLSNGARIERVNAFGNLRPYGMAASAGVTVNYRYIPGDVEENHERYVRGGQIRVASGLLRESKLIAAAWQGPR